MGLRGAIAFVKAPCQLDVCHDGASCRLFTLLLGYHVFPQRGLTSSLALIIIRSVVFFDEGLGANASLTNSNITILLITHQRLTASLVPIYAAVLLATHEAFRSVVAQ